MGEQRERWGETDWEGGRTGRELVHSHLTTRYHTLVASVWALHATNTRGSKGAAGEVADWMVLVGTVEGPK